MLGAWRMNDVNTCFLIFYCWKSVGFTYHGSPPSKWNTFSQKGV